ncbi:MAG TPA: response regulator transcription factor [Pirellulaceae bacterium]|nr:response regulator transcription factor [Pirellulaceae bacterium]HMO93085.1 response regulator transcription factor [Pirellulaceae bacterium]HMP69964.1 response regulator transcription factor [Pirellulaceae bacterium]
MENRPIIFLIDDDQISIAGVSRLLSSSKIRLITGTDAGLRDLNPHAFPKRLLDLVRVERPALILTEVLYGDHDMLNVFMRARDMLEANPVVVLSERDQPIFMARAVAVGARDFLSKRLPVQQLKQAILDASTQASATGQVEFAKMRSLIFEREDPFESRYSLTRRESQVLRHLRFGLSNQEVSASLGLSLETVKEHVQNLLRKTSMEDRIQFATHPDFVETTLV